MKREDGRTAMTTSTKVAALALTASAGAALLLSLGACESVPLTAAPGSSMTLIANPPFVIANGGTSVVTAILVEPAGTFVPDGTVVFFFTDLGRVDPSEAKTKNGVARVTFVADSRSGQATITAISGGPAPAPTASSGTGTGTTAAAATAAGTNSATTPIAIGGALPARLVVAADPARITSPRAAAIVATVYDQYGNPVQNVPVNFAITASTTTIEETLDSGGAPRYTDSNGQAFDTLRTRSAGPGQKAVTVTATAPPGLSTDVKVFIN
jgi:hypothetical protein